MTKILCKNNEAKAICLDLYTSGQVGAEISFEFSEEWEGLAKTVVFSAGDVQRDVLMQEGEDTITIPWEVLQKAGEVLIVGVYGIRGSELVIPTIYCRLGRVQRGADPSGDPGIPPTPSILDQAIAAAAAALASAQEAAAKAAAALQSATSAEDAADAAQAAAAAATQAAAAAALALQTAQDAAASAGESANMASAAFEAAALAKNAAELAKTAAEAAKTAAQTAATNAGQSATTATEKASQAAENAAASAAAASAAAASAASAAESAASAAESEAAVKTMVDRMGNVPVVSSTEFVADAETVIHKSTLVNIKTGVTDTEEAPLPVANTQQAGVMTAETVQAIMDLTAAVSTLSGQSVRLSYIDGASPTAAEIQAFVISKGYTDQTRWEYIAVVVKADKHVWRYYTGTGWQDDGIDTVSVATEYILGVVLGSSADGKVYVEADGTMSVNGYDAIISALENLSTGKADDNNVYHEWRLGYNATAQAITKDGTTVPFSDVYAAVEDKTKFVYVEWSNRVYIPQYVSGGLIYFMCAYIDSGFIKLERIMFDASTGKALTGSLSTYDKNKIDELLRAKANASEVYTKTEIDEQQKEQDDLIDEFIAPAAREATQLSVLEKVRQIYEKIDDGGGSSNLNGFGLKLGTGNTVVMTYTDPLTQRVVASATLPSADTQAAMLRPLRQISRNIFNFTEED